MTAVEHSGTATPWRRGGARPQANIGLCLMRPARLGTSHLPITDRQIDAISDDQVLCRDPISAVAALVAANRGSIP